MGQTIFGTAGVVLSGQPLKVAMQCGFSLTQIGEFAFIIAALGVSLNVTSSFLYPIVVAVSVITTFLTPYMIRLAVPAYNIVEKKMPEKWKQMLERYAFGSQTVNNENNWKKLLVDIARIVAIYARTLCCSYSSVSPICNAVFLHGITRILGEVVRCCIYDCLYLAIPSCHCDEEKSWH